jgi:hypothetical protein
VALGILSVVLVALGGLMYQVSVRTRSSTARAFLSAAMQDAQSRVEAAPWDSLPSLANPACVTDTSGQLVYNRCTTVIDTADLRRVQVVVIPIGNLTAPANTLVVYRVEPWVSIIEP